MSPVLVSLAAFVIVFVSAQMGSKAGAYNSLSGMLSTALGLMAGLRYWFLASRWLGQHESTWAPGHALMIFWAILIAVVFIASKLRHDYTDTFESVFPSLVDRLLGGLFGLVSGLAIMAALMMTLTIAAPQFWPAYKPDQLPLPMDRWPIQAYRLIETRIAGISASDQGHTLLPSLKEKSAGAPVDFWK